MEMSEGVVSRPLIPILDKQRRRPGLHAPVGVLRVQELQRDAGFREPAVDAGPVGAGVCRPGVALAGEQQRVGRLLGRPLDVLPGDAPLPRGHQHVLDAVLQDVGGAGDRVLRQTVHRPQPQDPPLALALLAMWNLLVLWTAWQPERNGDARGGV